MAATDVWRIAATETERNRLPCQEGRHTANMTSALEPVTYLQQYVPSLSPNPSGCRTDSVP